MALHETVWTQCLMELTKLARIRGVELKVSEVDRLAALVTQEIRVDATLAILSVVSDTANGFDDEIPF